MGINIQIIEVPFEGVYEKEKTEFGAGTGAFDVVTFYPACMGDFASPETNAAVADADIFTLLRTHIYTREHILK